jgi:CRP-like cAMP-binding protein
MANDVRALREEAAQAAAAGKHKRALAAYLELERLEPRDAQWAKRAGETYRRLGNNNHAVQAFNRSVERYAQNGFLVQAIAVCKIILQIDPNDADTLKRLAEMNQQVGAGPTRSAVMAENNPALHENPNVELIRRASTGIQRVRPEEIEAMRKAHPTLGSGTGSQSQPIAISRTRSTNPPPVVARTRSSTKLPSDPMSPIAVSRTKSKPITLAPGSPLVDVSLQKEVPESQVSAPGIHLIPIDDDYGPMDDVEDRPSAPIVVDVEASGDTYDAEVEEFSELEIDDIEEIPLPQPKVIGEAGRRALAATPLFAGLEADTLQALVENLALITLERGEHLFREGDPGDALYVIVEGEVSVQAEGPPRVEMTRLGPGAFIGEVALMTDQPHAATVTALGAAELLRIDRVTLSRVLGEHGDVLRPILRFVRDRLVDRWTRTSPLFRPFNDQQRAELAARFNFLEIDTGTKLLTAGKKPEGLYIVLAGQFTVSRNNISIATLAAGDLIGETALLSGGVFKSDVIARGKGLALCLPASDFREVIMYYPHVLEYIGEQAEHSRRLQIL